MKKKKDSLIILSIEGGKSLIFILFAFIEKKQMIIVIISFVELMKDIKKWCEKMDLFYHIWKKTKQILNNKKIQIILVIIEHIIIMEFQQFLIKLKAFKCFAKIVINEYYIIIMHKSFKSIVK